MTILFSLALVSVILPMVPAEELRDRFARTLGYIGLSRMCEERGEYNMGWNVDVFVNKARGLSANDYVHNTCNCTDGWASVSIQHKDDPFVFGVVYFCALWTGGDDYDKKLEDIYYVVDVREHALALNAEPYYTQPGRLLFIRKVPTFYVEPPVGPILTYQFHAPDWCGGAWSYQTQVCTCRAGFKITPSRNRSVICNETYTYGTELANISTNPTNPPPLSLPISTTTTTTTTTTITTTTTTSTTTTPTTSSTTSTMGTSTTTVKLPETTTITETTSRVTESSTLLRITTTTTTLRAPTSQLVTDNGATDRNNVKPTDISPPMCENGQWSEVYGVCICTKGWKNDPDLKSQGIYCTVTEFTAEAQTVTKEGEGGSTAIIIVVGVFLISFSLWAVWKFIIQPHRRSPLRWYDD